jgi:hypothetical protein
LFAATCARAGAPIAKIPKTIAVLAENSLKTRIALTVFS